VMPNATGPVKSVSGGTPMPLSPDK
jgi:hypothetical protein